MQPLLQMDPYQTLLQLLLARYFGKCGIPLERLEVR